MRCETLLGLQVQAVLQKPLKHIEADVGNVLLHVTGKNENVVQISKHKMVQEVSQDITDKGLEDDWCIGQVKGHN